MSKRKTLSKLPIKVELAKAKDKFHRKAYLLQKNKFKGEKWKKTSDAFLSGF